MQDFQKLLAWRQAYALSLEVYSATRGFPPEERFGLASQMRRAAVSIGANIAEGRGRGSDPDFARFLGIATGSAFELDHYLQLSRDLGYLEAAEEQRLEAALAEVRRLVWGLVTKLRSGPRKP